ncbi:MAG: hypothetical protein BWX66_00855 [Deltaproteobacteria bacterium ADurb.Bin058]|nr:MAG: hypothetical protein BWX66_00855 [Deltaproteobacteria bacterium ADurb.Bin058]
MDRELAAGLAPGPALGLAPGVVPEPVHLPVLRPAGLVGQLSQDSLGQVRHQPALLPARPANQLVPPGLALAQPAPAQPVPVQPALVQPVPAQPAPVQPALGLLQPYACHGGQGPAPRV